MDKAIITKSYLTSIADAIRAKSGGTDLMTPEEMAAAVGNIKGGEDPLPYIEDTLSELKNSTAKKVAAYKFSHSKSLTYVSLPAVTEIESCSFTYAELLESIDIPELITIGQDAFSYSGLKNVDLKKLKTVGANAFKSCKNLVSAILPAVESVDGSGFMACSSLKKVILSSVETLGTYTFSGTTSSYYCSSLVFVDLGNVSAIQMLPSKNLKSLILRRTNGLATYNSVSYIQSACPIRSGGGHIYVPSDLIESYQTATNWATIYAENPRVFRSLEEFTADGTTTGDIDEEKISTADSEEA